MILNTLCLSFSLHYSSFFQRLETFRLIPKQCHSCVEKAAKIALVNLRSLETDDNFSLRGMLIFWMPKFGFQFGLNNAGDSHYRDGYYDDYSNVMTSSDPRWFEALRKSMKAFPIESFDSKPLPIENGVHAFWFPINFLMAPKSNHWTPIIPISLNQKSDANQPLMGFIDFQIKILSQSDRRMLEPLG